MAMQESSINKKLSVSYPPITTYTHHSNLLSIICNYKESLSWLFSNYIQIFIYKDFSKGKWGWGDFYFSNLGHPFEACPWIDELRISKEIINSKYVDVIDFIIDCINSNYYVNLMANAYFIKAYEKLYHNIHHKHDLFVFGYDVKKKVVYAADFFYKSKYEYGPISFAEFKEAFTSCAEDKSWEYLKHIKLFRFNDEYNYEFYIDSIVKYIQEYLLITEPSYMYNKSHVAYGLNYYDVLKKNLSYHHAVRNSDLFIPPFHLIYDHKRIMLSRLEFLNSIEYLSLTEFQNFHDKYSNITFELESMRNLLMKVIITKNTDYLDKAINILEKVPSQEKKVLTEILDLLLQRPLYFTTKQLFPEHNYPYTIKKD
ncbi:MAG: hypothetical protein JXJ04_08340 [Spirochaetales bacterium]|nr:hypothetical protein [Spirochaetales bacterium]